MKNLKIVILLLFLSCATKIATIKTNSEYFKTCSICKKDTNFWKLKLRIDKFPIRGLYYICDNVVENYNNEFLITDQCNENFIVTSDIASN